MMPELRGQLSKTLLYQLHLRNGLKLCPSMRLRFFSSMDVAGDGSDSQRQALGKDQATSGSHTREDSFTSGNPKPVGLTNNDNLESDYNYENYRRDKWGRQNPPEPIPNRPLRGEKPTHRSEHRFHGNSGLRSGGRREYDRNKPVGPAGNRAGRQVPSTGNDPSLFDRFAHESKENMNQHSQYCRPQISSLGDKQDNDFLQKFKLGFDKEDNQINETANPSLGKQEDMKAHPDPENLPPPQDADEIFKKMKETGLIPNAVAMLDGLCKDGLVQEAMKLFGLMREKGTIPEVVIYTAVVEGFCKAQKLDDAMRIFRKMQNNSISPNAFSYTVLIQGLYKGKRLDDALNFCLEMLEAGHSPNLATFVGLVDGFCREKGLEDARSVIGTLGQKGFAFDEKAVREYLDKKGPYLPQVWEAILGKTSKQRFF
ncbi:hypothetical protein NMG60_11020560 [Bertholletia excelsa]